MSCIDSTYMMPKIFKHSKESNNMRVTWKDSVQNLEIRQYKQHYMFKEQQGWSVSIPGDDNIYGGVAYACNAINEYLGIQEKPPSLGGKIKVIGKTTSVW